MNIKITALVAFTFSSTLFAEEKKEEWIQLFNGKDLEGWTPKVTKHPLGENFADTWRVADGLLQVRYDKYPNGFEEQYGHLFYKTPYSHYRLRFEYRFVGEQVKGGPGWAVRNNGFMIHCQDPKTMTVEQEFPTSIEVQLLGGNGKDERPTMNLCTPGTTVDFDGKTFWEHGKNSTSKTYHGDVWVTAEIEVKGDHVKHIIDGQTVLEYNRVQYEPTDKNKALIKDPKNLLISSGYISIQGESAPCDFKKIELLVLEGNK